MKPKPKAEKPKTRFGTQLDHWIGRRKTIPAVVAKRAKVPASYLSRLSTVNSDPSLYRVERIARALGITLDQFLREDEPELDDERVGILNPHEEQLITAYRSIPRLQKRWDEDLQNFSPDEDDE